MTEFADDAATENARKRLEEAKQQSDKTRAAAFEHTSKGRPTPTQEENDMAALGAHILKHDDDGSGPDPFATRNLEAGHSAAPYQTRHERPTHSPPPRSRSSE
jgi:hypothetical protein